MKDLAAVFIGLILFVIPVAVFLYMFREWYLYGKDPVSNKPLIPQYDLPDNITPLQAAGILRGKVTAKDVSAEIIYLAINGFLTIEKITRPGFLTTEEDYLLRKTECDKPLSAASRRIMDGLFGALNTQVEMSSLRKRFFVYVEMAQESVMEWLGTEGYYVSNPRQVFLSYALIVGVIFLAWSMLMRFEVLSLFDPWIANAIKTDVFVSAAIVMGFAFLMPSRTPKGLSAREHILGLKEYLAVAEKDRIIFHNSPEKNPERFEKFLPFAIMFEFEKGWIREFEGIYNEPLSNWYVGGNSRNQAPSVFSGDIKDISGSLTGMIDSISNPTGSGKESARGKGRRTG